MDRLVDLLPELWSATAETLYVVSLALIFGGVAGLLLGLALYATRPGSLFPQRAVFGVLNVLVNFFRPIPFVILLAAVQPIARSVGIPGIGPEFGIFAITLASMFAISRRSNAWWPRSKANGDRSTSCSTSPVSSKSDRWTQ